MGQNNNFIQHSFNAGEVSERFDARQDQNKRQAALARSENWQGLTLGGVRRREGSIYVAQCKVVADHPIHRLFEMRAANTAAYVLELGHLYMRFFFNGLPIFSSGSTPLELSTPWSDTHLAELYPCGSVEVLYFMHRLFPVQKLSRTSNTTFTLSQVNFNPPATVEEEPSGSDLSGGVLQPGAISGNNVVFYADGSPFRASDVGRLILSGASRALITGFVDIAHVNTDIIDAFPSTGLIAPANWRLKLSPQVTLDVEDGKKEAGETATITAAGDPFRGIDAGKYMQIFGGLVKITLVTSSLVVQTKIISELKDITTATPSPTRAWTMEVASWSATRGYPNCATFYGERFYLFKGLTINGSVVNDFENFAKGAGDSDAIQRNVSDDDIDSIVWAKGMENSILIGTGSGAFKARATTEGGAITPDSIKVDPISARSSAKIPPLRIGSLLHYVQLGQRKIRELVFDDVSQRFKSPNLFQLAEHLTEAFYVTEMKYAAEPDSIIQVMRSDGTLLPLTYQDEENVLGWARTTTKGKYKSVAVIPRPSTGKDWVWNIVSRENGDFIEYFEPDAKDTGREWNEIQTDSAVLVTHDVNFLVTLPDNHLDGETVRVIGDGMLFDDAVVVNAQFQLTPEIPVSKIEVGLDYVSDGLTLEPILPTELGGPFIARGYLEVGARIRRALGLTIGGTTIAHRKPVHSMSAAVPLQKGKIGVDQRGYDAFGRIPFKQTVPFPAEILNIVGKLHVGDEWQLGTEDQAGDAFVFIGGGDVEDTQVIALVIVNPTTDYNIYHALQQQGWNEISPVEYTLTVNAVVRASSTSAFAITTGGVLPPNSPQPVWAFHAAIEGKFGAAGIGGFGATPATNGQPGGDAIWLDYDVTIDNTDGFIYGGPGGGGGGGGGEI